MNKKEDLALREHLLNLLKGGQAYMPFDHAVKDFLIQEMNTIFPNGTYSAWDLLEHIRITQNDILEFIVSSKYKEKQWPKDYWPDPKKNATQKDWDNTIKEYKADLEKLKNIVLDEKINLYAKIPHGDGQTNLREILLVADHTAYHIGEFAIMRQIMNTWNKRNQ
jgi:hypothetical protein